MTKRLRAGLLGLVLVGALGLGACAPGTAGVSPTEDAIRSSFGPIADQAMRGANSKSALDPGSFIGGGCNWGLGQINTGHSGTFQAVTGRPFYNDARDPYANAQFAAWLYNNSGGWGPWACRWAA